MYTRHTKSNDLNIYNTYFRGLNKILKIIAFDLKVQKPEFSYSLSLNKVFNNQAAIGESTI